ncbi:MAG TPA: 4Fe-4S dicluster domain-containing protein [Firmicutes bacterium]|nr:4Fe-4S dicluster domain-containing protein [Bacillota bacterium]
MLKKTGIPEEEELKLVLPDDARRKRGPFAVFECFERIPCNPCYDACPMHAVMPFEDINDLPRLDLDRCNGCGNCVAQCPGLAVFVVDETYSEDEALLKLPYEFVPLPLAGSEVDLLDREGKKVGRGKVVRVQKARHRTATPVVWVTVPKHLSMVVRNIGGI